MKTFLCVLSVCVVVARAQTDCEGHRERELKSDARVRLVPECDANGDYEALQCFEGSSPFCMCWRPDGSRISGPTRKIETCACHVHRDRELARSRQGMVGNFVPSCEEDGTYRRKQCHGSTGYCWCADESGNRLTDQVRGEPNC